MRHPPILFVQTMHWLCKVIAFTCIVTAIQAPMIYLLGFKIIIHIDAAVVMIKLVSFHRLSKADSERKE
jgi:hypothetical protein